MLASRHVRTKYDLRLLQVCLLVWCPSAGGLDLTASIDRDRCRKCLGPSSDCPSPCKYPDSTYDARSIFPFCWLFFGSRRLVSTINPGVRPAARTSACLPPRLRPQSTGLSGLIVRHAIATRATSDSDHADRGGGKAARDDEVRRASINGELR